MNRVIDNLDYLGYLLYFSKSNLKSYKYNNERRIIDEMKKNSKIMDHLINDIHISDNNILGKLKMLDDLEGEQYNKLYDEIIQVGEFKNN